MPALLGYVIAIVVFLGSGYAGLEWLAAPDVPPVHRVPNDKTASVRPPRAESNPAVPPPNLIAERIDDSKTDIPTGSADNGKDDMGKDDVKQPDRTAENLNVAGSDAVPAGGCMPIGLTAGGEMVFPLQCRSLLEAQRGPVVSSNTEQKQFEPKPDSLQPPANSSTSADAIATERHSDSPSKNEVAVSEPAPSAKDLDTHPAVEPSASANAAPPIGRRAPSVDDAPAVSPPQGGKIKSTPLVKRQKLETLKPASGRSKLVKMTLLTIEFPDGHREQRLVPYRHRAVPVQDAR